MVHPEPFKLTYVEIGNEDNSTTRGATRGGMRSFIRRSRRSTRAAVDCDDAVEGDEPDVVDDHYYVRAQEFFKDQTHYDKIDRNGPRFLWASGRRVRARRHRTLARHWAMRRG